MAPAQRSPSGKCAHGKSHSVLAALICVWTWCPPVTPVLGAAFMSCLLQEEDILPHHPVYPFISGREMASYSKWNLKEAPTPKSVSSTGPTFKLPFWLVGPDLIWPSLPAWNQLEEIKACRWKGLVGPNGIKVLPNSPLLREAKSKGSPIWQISLINLPFGGKKKHQDNFLV